MSLIPHEWDLFHSILRLKLITTIPKLQIFEAFVNSEGLFCIFFMNNDSLIVIYSFRNSCSICANFSFSSLGNSG